MDTDNMEKNTPDLDSTEPESESELNDEFPRENNENIGTVNEIIIKDDKINDNSDGLEHTRLAIKALIDPAIITEGGRRKKRTQKRRNKQKNPRKTKRRRKTAKK